MLRSPLLLANPVILDSGAIIAWLEGEPGASLVAQVLEDHPGRLHMHAVNVCEVLYHARRAHGPARMLSVRALMTSAGIREHTEMDPALVDAAAVLKADIARVSLADCFLLALARRLGGEVLTTDRSELDAPGPRAVCPIHFAR